jgi:hypothetical protein
MESIKEYNLLGFGVGISVGVQMTSDGVIYIPSFMKSGSGI